MVCSSDDLLDDFGRVTNFAKHHIVNALFVLLCDLTNAMKLRLEDVHAQSKFLADRILSENMRAKAIGSNLFLNIIRLDGAQAVLNSTQVQILVARVTSVQ